MSIWINRNTDLMAPYTGISADISAYISSDISAYISADISQDISADICAAI